jgi:transcriptional regulator with XRE-family HTH domain
MSFRDRLVEYRAYMGLSQTELAHALGHKKRTSVAAYERVKEARTPTGHDLKQLVECTGLNLEWLFEVQGSSMWSAQVQLMRRQIRARVAEVQAGNELERVRAVIRLVQSFLPLANESWFSASILFVSIPAYTSFMDSDGMISSLSIRRIADFTAIPDDWFWDGDQTRLTPLDLSSWEDTVSAFEGLGIDPPSARMNAERLAQWINRVKQLDA